MKTEWEKTRDVMDYCEGLRSGNVYNAQSAAGAMARPAHVSPVSRRPVKSAAPVTPNAGPTAPLGAKDRAILILIFAVIVLLAIAGAGLALTRLDDSWASPAVRAIAGAVALPLAAGAAFTIAMRLIAFVLEVLVPALIRLAIVGGVILVALEYMRA